MEINVIKASYVQETLKDLSKKKIFKVLDKMSVTEKLPLHITLWWIEIKHLITLIVMKSKETQFLKQTL